MPRDMVGDTFEYLPPPPTAFLFEKATSGGGHFEFHQRKASDRGVSVTTGVRGADHRQHTQSPRIQGISE